MRLFLIAALSMALATGCVSEAHRQLNHQNREAAKEIRETSSEPAIVQAATDIEQNSESLAKHVLGEPEEKKPYSMEASAAARKQAEENASGGWLWYLLTGAASVIGLELTRGGISKFFPKLLALAPQLIGGPAGKVAAALVNGVATARDNAESTGGTITVAQLLQQLKLAQEQLGVRGAVKELAHASETKILGKKL